jgi:hypothetical protein
MYCIIFSTHDRFQTSVQRLPIYGIYLIPQLICQYIVPNTCAYRGKCSRDLDCEIMHIPFPQSVDLFALAFSFPQDIFVNALNNFVI